MKLSHMDDRTREVFGRIIQQYLSTGAPVGSQVIANLMDEKISSATIRNIMHDLEGMGILDSPHVSAGRLPTQQGLRLFVDGLLEFEEPSKDEKNALKASLGEGGGDIDTSLNQFGAIISDITKSASLVLTPKSEAPIKHIEFVTLSESRALVVMVLANDKVENRIFTMPTGQTPSSIREAANFLNAVAQGRTLEDLKALISREIKKERHKIDNLAASLIEAGIAVWQDEGTQNERLIIRGQANLLENPKDQDDLERIRVLFEELERKCDIVNILNLVEDGQGVRIFIGSENNLFSLSGSSLIITPYMNGSQKIIGALGLIGPTRLNYGRVVSVVNYSAQLLGNLLSNEG